jgi:membrane protease YdiL (CAAX protease family)
MHANFYQFFYAFALGLVLGYVYYITGNVWYGVGLHAALNFVGSVVTSYLNIGAVEMNDALMRLDLGSVDGTIAFFEKYWFIFFAEYGFLLFTFVSMISAIALPIIFREKIVLERRLPAPPRGKMFSAAFLNVGVILLLAVYAFEFIISLIPPAVG